MTDHTLTALNEVRVEREYQQKKWGQLDDQNTPHQWSAYIGHYSNRNLIGDPSQVSLEKFRTDMIKVAALAVAAVETIDRRKAAK